MSALQLLDARLFEVLAATRLSPAEQDRVVDLCESAVEIATALRRPHPGRTARCAAHLLVDDVAPDLDPAVREQLARACEMAVVLGL